MFGQMKVAGYIRVSTADQALHGYSLEAQTDLIKRYCDAHGYALTKIYADEGVSASKALQKRHGIISLLDDAEAGKFDTVVFKDLTRWSRSPNQFYAVQDRLDRAKISWIAIEQPNLETVTAQGRLMVGITISVASHESSQTSERLKFVFDSKVRNGDVINGRTPLGYDIKTIDGKKKLVINEEEAQIVRQLYDFYEVHQSIMATVRYAAELGWKRTDVAIRRILHNAIYIGQYRDNENYCEPIIDRAQWNRVQSLLNKHQYVPHTPNLYLFTGLLKCAECGYSMTASMTDGREYYQCLNAKKYHRCDHTKMIREDEIEKYLINNVDGELKKYKIKVKKPKKKDPAPLKAKLERLKELYIDGIIDRSEYDKRREVIEKSMAESVAQKPVFDLPDDWKEIYANATKEARKAAWRSVIAQISIDKENNIDVQF